MQELQKAEARRLRFNTERKNNFERYRLECAEQMQKLTEMHEREKAHKNECLGLLDKKLREEL